MEREQPDVAIVDVRMPPTHTDEGTKVAKELKSERPDLGVLVLSQIVESVHALDLFSDHPEGFGYLLKDRVLAVDEFLEAVRRVADGGTVIDPEVVSQLFARKRRKDLVDELTERERETLRLMAEGRSNSAIASSLHMSEKTVEGHVRSIFSKLQLEPAAEDHRRVLAVLTYLKA